MRTQKASKKYSNMLLPEVLPPTLLKLPLEMTRVSRCDLATELEKEMSQRRTIGEAIFCKGHKMRTQFTF